MKVRGGKLKNQRRKKIKNKPEKIMIRNYEDEMSNKVIHRIMKFCWESFSSEGGKTLQS